MSDLKSTPGPWHVEQSDNGGIFAIAADGKSLAAVWPESVLGVPLNADANAHLIAAAPDLYEALEAFVRALNTNELAALLATHNLASFANVEDALKIALPALAHARGETS